MGRTPERIVNLLKAEIPAKISRNKFCIKTGINQNSIDKYMAGIAEPTQASMEKLAAYFCMSVSELRGEDLLEIELNEKILQILLSGVESQASSEKWSPAEIAHVKKIIHSTYVKKLSSMMPDGNYEIKFDRVAGITFTFKVTKP